MARHSRIEWTHKVSPACRHCYAESWSRRFGLKLCSSARDNYYRSVLFQSKALRWFLKIHALHASLLPPAEKK
jgi:hypothetical protein